VTEIESSVDRALARLAARPGWELTCWSCGHKDEVPTDPAKVDAYRCDKCGATTAFGEPMPRVTIVPHVDRRFLVTKFESGKGDAKTGVDITLARGYAAEFALEVLSVTEPGAYRDFVALVRARQARKAVPDPKDDSRGTPAPATGDGGLELDAPPGRNPGSVGDGA